MKKIILNIITIICIIEIRISGYKVFTTLKDYKKADNVYSNIRDAKEETSSIDLSKKMSEINSDYKCWINVDGIFKVSNTPSLKGKTILLVDDVITTGSTLEAIVKSFQKNETPKIYIIALGMAM